MRPGPATRAFQAWQPASGMASSPRRHSDRKRARRSSRRRSTGLSSPAGRAVAARVIASPAPASALAVGPAWPRTPRRGRSEASPGGEAGDEPHPPQHPGPARRTKGLAGWRLRPAVQSGPSTPRRRRCGGRDGGRWRRRTPRSRLAAEDGDAAGGWDCDEPQAGAAGWGGGWGIAALGPGPKTAKPAPGHEIFVVSDAGDGDRPRRRSSAPARAARSPAPSSLAGLPALAGIWMDGRVGLIRRLHRAAAAVLKRRRLPERLRRRRRGAGRDCRADRLDDGRPPHQALAGRTPLAVWRRGSAARPSRTPWTWPCAWTTRARRPHAPRDDNSSRRLARRD